MSDNDKKTPLKNAQDPTIKKSGKLKLYFFFGLLLFFIILGIFSIVDVFSFISARTMVTEPIGDYVKSIGIGATPQVRPDTVTIVREINNLAQLQTVSMHLEKVISADLSENDLFGLFDNSMIFVAVGDVRAGIDLAKMTHDDIQAYSFDKVVLRLPPSEVLSSALDNELSFVADRDEGIGSRIFAEDQDFETIVRQAGEEAILEAALENDILGIADINAENVLRGLLTSLGFQSVEFVKGEMPITSELSDDVPKGFIIETDG